MVKNSNKVQGTENNGIELDLLVKRESFKRKDTNEVFFYTSFTIDVDGEKFSLQAKQEDKRYLNRLLKEQGVVFEDEQGKIADNAGSTFALTVKRENFTRKETGEIFYYTSFTLGVDGERFTLSPKQEDKRYLNRLLKEQGLYFEDGKGSSANTDGAPGSDLPL